MLEKNLKEDFTSVEDALINAFIHANTALMGTPIKYMTSGSTCVATYINGNTYWVANAGDSRAVLARRSPNDPTKHEAIDLSRDHKPDDPEEQSRIEAWGGFVMPSPEEGLSARVYLDPEFTMIGLAMGRSIGASRRP
jgi:serine/threonine protein phosphatase PrpC